MSERTIGDIAQDNETYNTSYDEQAQVEQSFRENSFSFDFIKAKTGEGSIEDYLEHPLNFNHSKGMGRMIRGLTGLFGDLDLAIVDIMIGALDVVKLTKSKGVGKDVNVYSSGGNASVS